MKNKIFISVIGVILSTALLVANAILTEEKIINSETSIVLMTVSVILLLVSVFYACKVDYETGVYQCRKCGHTFKPTFNAYVWGAHTLTTRCLKCPKCEEKSWCKRKTAK